MTSSTSSLLSSFLSSIVSFLTSVTVPGFNISFLALFLGIFGFGALIYFCKKMF